MSRFRIAAAWGLAMLMPTLVAAQSQSGSTQTTGTQTGTQTTGTQSGTQTSGTQTSGTTTGDQTSTAGQGGGMGGWMGTDSHWLGSGFVGSSFGAEDADGNALDFGGSVGYLWRGAVGAEFQANFSPDFELDPVRSALFSGEQPWINTYMFNAVAAVPINEGRFQPYVSGGLGMMTLRSDAILGSDGDTNEVSPDDSRGAGNFGAGFMAFAGNVGFRADVRWFRGFDAGDDFDTSDDSTGDAIGRIVLSDLSFWRANVGLGFRW